MVLHCIGVVVLIPQLGAFYAPSHRACRSGYVAMHCMLSCFRSDLVSWQGAAFTCSHRVCSTGSVARYLGLVFVRSYLASEPSAVYTSQGLESVAKFILPFPRESYHSNRWANLIRETEDNSLLKGLIQLNKLKLGIAFSHLTSTKTTGLRPTSCEYRAPARQNSS